MDSPCDRCESNPMFIVASLELCRQSQSYSVASTGGRWDECQNGTITKAPPLFMVVSEEGVKGKLHAHNVERERRQASSGAPQNFP